MKKKKIQHHYNLPPTHLTFIPTPPSFFLKKKKSSKIKVHKYGCIQLLSDSHYPTPDFGLEAWILI